MKIRNKQTLLLRSLDAELSAEDQQRLKALLAASDSARSAYAQFKAIRRSAQELEPARFTEGFASRVMEAVNQPAVRPKIIRFAPSAPVYSIYSGRLLRVAAVILLLVAVGALVWMQPRSYSVPAGKMASRMLPDGTKVQLSSGSTLTYKPFWGRPGRVVRLEGEAFFDVTKSGKPFIVETFNAGIQVLGTRFNVKAWPGSDVQQTLVTLEEGRVGVSALDRPGETIELEPEHTVAVRGDTTLPVRRLSRTIASHLAWRNGGFAFEDETLASAAAELERRYAVALTLDDRIAQKRIGYFAPRALPLADVLTAITQTHELAFRPTANGYEIFQP